MATLPDSVADFLQGKRIAIAGVSRSGQEAANAVFRKLRDSGYEAFPINPATREVEGVRCFPDLVSVTGSVDGLVIATHPKVSIELVRQCLERGIRRVWFHRSFGQGTVSEEAVRECQDRATASSGAVRSCTASRWTERVVASSGGSACGVACPDKRLVETPARRRIDAVKTT
jgi:predicted CoA-binding protein